MIVPKVVKMGVYIFQEDKDSLIVEGATRPGFLADFPSVIL
jgi:hypothetical protein